MGTQSSTQKKNKNIPQEVEVIPINPPQEDHKEKSIIREKIAQEILQTERNYVKSLTQLKTVWEKPLRDSLSEYMGKRIMPKEDIRSIFSNAEAILGLHEIILETFEQKISAWDDKTEIGQVFINNSPGLKLYVEYVNNYENSMKTIAKSLRTKEFSLFVKNVVGVVDTYDLSSLLIQPVQRIPRYALLLRDLVRNTWSSHPDLGSLLTALNEIEKVAKFIDDQKKNFENSQRILEVQNKIGEKYEIFSPHRFVILEGKVKLVRSARKQEEVQFCLLNDVLLIWEETEKSLLNSREGKVHIYEEIGNISVKETTNLIEGDFTLVTAKKEWVLIPSEESVLKKEDFIKAIKEVKADKHLPNTGSNLKLIDSTDNPKKEEKNEEKKEEIKEEKKEEKKVEKKEEIKEEKKEDKKEEKKEEIKVEKREDNKEEKKRKKQKKKRKKKKKKKQNLLI